MLRFALSTRATGGRWLGGILPSSSSSSSSSSSFFSVSESFPRQYATRKRGNAKELKILNVQSLSNKARSARDRQLVQKRPSTAIYDAEGREGSEEEEDDDDSGVLLFSDDDDEEDVSLLQAARSRIPRPTHPTHPNGSPSFPNLRLDPNQHLGPDEDGEEDEERADDQRNARDADDQDDQDGRGEEEEEEEGEEEEEFNFEDMILGNLNESLEGPGGDLSWLRESPNRINTGPGGFLGGEGQSGKEDGDGEGEGKGDPFFTAGAGARKRKQGRDPGSVKEAHKLVGRLEHMKEEMESVKAQAQKETRRKEDVPPPDAAHAPGQPGHCSTSETASLWGCEPCVHRFCLEDPQHLAEFDSPLHLATLYNSTAMVQLLLIGPDTQPDPEAFAEAGRRARAKQPRGGGGLPVMAYDPDLANAKGATALHWAAHHGNEQVCLMLLMAGANPSPADQLGITPMLVAASEDRPRVMQLLQSYGARVDETDLEGNQAVHTATLAGAMKALFFLKRFHADMNARNRRQLAPIHLAIGEHRDIHMLMVLLRLGADPMCLSIHNYTPLHLAVSKGAPDMIGALLATEKVDINARESGHGMSPLHAAADLEDDEMSFQCMALLLNPIAEDKPQALTPQLNLPDEEGLTPLHLAASHGNGKTLVLLLRMGANPNAPSHQGATPLHYAVSQVEGAIFRLLLDLGRADVTCQDHLGSNPLHAACQIDDPPLRFSFAKAIIEYYAESLSKARLPSHKIAAQLKSFVSTPDYDGYTPLHIVCAQDEAPLDTAKLLVENGAEVNCGATSEDCPIKVTPAEIAVQRGDEELSEYLFAHGAVIDWQKLSNDQDELEE